jgi:fluoride exporter
LRGSPECEYLHVVRMLQIILLLGAGGALGAVLRYALAGLAHGVLGETFPWGTLLVNVLGCFVIGLLWAAFEASTFSPELRIFVFAGVLGSFTTFSTFGVETFHLFRDGQIGLALVNVFGTNFACLSAVVVGFFVARFLIEMGGGT